jgi:anti-anti-sigma factor
MAQGGQMLTLTKQMHGDTVVVNLEGTIDGSDSCRRIHEIMKDGLSTGHKQFVLNFEGVDWINSLGVGYLAAASVSAVKDDADIRLVGLSPRVDPVLRACGIVPHVWMVFESMSEALESFD